MKGGATRSMEHGVVDMRDCETCEIEKCCSRKTINRVGGYCWLEEYTKEEQNKIIEMRMKWIEEQNRY